jgi:hypothetical protein
MMEDFAHLFGELHAFEMSLLKEFVVCGDGGVTRTAKT